MFKITTSKKIVLATSNTGKIKEFSELTQGMNIECIPQKKFKVQDADESGITFAENAIIKARHASKICKMPAIADDSGLIVDALNGEPGIYSARYAGDNRDFSQNIDKVLQKLDKVPSHKRNARFYCVIVFIEHENDPAPVICGGHWEGVILTHRQGEFGFGYDSIFYVEEEKCTAAEMLSDKKNKISHRAKAMAEFKRYFVV